MSNSRLLHPISASPCIERLAAFIWHACHVHACVIDHYGRGVVVLVPPTVRYPEFGGCLLLHNIYGDFSWYMIWQCPLYGRCLLLGVSVYNGESTVHELDGKYLIGSSVHARLVGGACVADWSRVAWLCCV